MSKKLNTSIAKIKNSSGKFEPMAALIGQSPYELAVEAGFEGTEQEWLQMMIGNGWVGAFQQLEKNITKLQEESVPKTRKINGQSLESDVSLTSEHIKVSKSTKDLYGIQDTAFNEANTDDIFTDLAYTRAIGPYLAFVGNVNSEQLDAAFGKNNEETVRGIGMALSMYAKWANPVIDLNQKFPNLKICATISEIFNKPEAIIEINENPSIISKIFSSSYIQMYESELKERNIVFPGAFTQSGYAVFHINGQYIVANVSKQIYTTQNFNGDELVLTNNLPIDEHRTLQDIFYFNGKYYIIYTYFQYLGSPTYYRYARVHCYKSSDLSDWTEVYSTGTTTTSSTAGTFTPNLEWSYAVTNKYLYITALSGIYNSNNKVQYTNSFTIRTEGTDVETLETISKNTADGYDNTKTVLVSIGSKCYCFPRNIATGTINIYNDNSSTPETDTAINHVPNITGTSLFATVYNGKIYLQVSGDLYEISSDLSTWTKILELGTTSRIHFLLHPKNMSNAVIFNSGNNLVFANLADGTKSTYTNDLALSRVIDKVDNTIFITGDTAPVEYKSIYFTD